jgi:hypothetical protein
MIATKKAARGKLTPHEKEQIQQIAAWKSEPPNPFGEMFRMVTLPVAKAVEKLLPDAMIRTSIERAYDASEMIATQDDLKAQAEVKDLREMKKKPLEECDRLATRVSLVSQTVSVAEGAVTGAGGVLTTLIDIPLLIVLSIRTILKIGHCYGYPLNTSQDRRYVLALLLAALSSSLEAKRERIKRLRDLEEEVFEETEEETIGQELASILFQLEIFEEVPGVGAASGALLNLALVRRVDVTAQRVFQERWLQDKGKISGAIEPAVAPYRVLETGWGGVMGRAAYTGCYYVGFGATLPVWLMASVFQTWDNPLTHGARDGATAASRQVSANSLGIRASRRLAGG